MVVLQDTVHTNRYSKTSSGLPPQRHGLYKFVEFHMRHSVVCLCYSCSNHYVLKEKQATHYCMPFKTFCSSNFYFAKCKNSLKAKTTYYSSTLLQNPKKESTLGMCNCLSKSLPY